MKIFGMFSQKEAVDTNPAEVEQERGLSIDQVGRVIEHFPIGSRIRYYPGFQKEVKIDSVLLAYGFNKHIVYSAQDVTYDREKAGICLNIKGGKLCLDRIMSFILLLPHVTRTEIDLEAGQGTAGNAAPKERQVNDFRRGNPIIIMSPTSKTSGMPHLDTVVIKTVRPKHGFYADRNLVVLEPIIDTFHCLDNRRFKRITTKIPVKLQIGQEEESCDCLLEDFSEKYFRIKILGSKRFFQLLTVGRTILLTLEADHQGQPLILRGNVYRKRRDIMVMVMQGTMKNNRFQPLNTIDELYIKAALLNRPETKRS